MKKNGFSHIRRWLWIYVFLVVMTTLAAYIFVFHEISDILNSLAQSSDANLSERPIPIQNVNGALLRVLLLLTAGMLAIVFFSIIWLRTVTHRINRPIHAIHLAVSRLAQGKLNETVVIENADEFGQIGSSINELAANLQELLLYIWKQTGQCIATLEHMKLILQIQEREQSSPSREVHLQELSDAIESLRQMAKSYVFFDVRLDGEQALSITPPGKKS